MSSYDKMAIVLSLDSEDDLPLFLEKINEHKESARKLKDIFKLIGYPVTVVCENHYVDKVFRDTYYSYFASKHLVISKDCKRLCFFRGKIEINKFYQYDKNTERELQKAFVGTCILKPIQNGKIGRTLLNVKKVNIDDSYVRTTQFDMIIFGHELIVEAFPFSFQDSETMTCAETTVWNIIEYFGTRYPEYKTILPSAIISEIGVITQERNLPSRGLDYYKVSQLLKTFGFAPRVYAPSEILSEKMHKRIFHYYIESGIPLAVGVSGKDKNLSIKHSIVCIGHASERKTLEMIEPDEIESHYGTPYVDSASFYDKYVTIDDNQSPYTIENFYEFTKWEEAKVVVFAVPLYKRVFLEAVDVRKIFAKIMENKILSFEHLRTKMKETVNENNPMITRTYLTSSRKYRRFRAQTCGNVQGAHFYATYPLPKFIWVVEIATYTSYLSGEIYGEVVIDATATRRNMFDSLIIIRYYDNIGYRFPDENSSVLFQRLRKKAKFLLYPFDMYENNLVSGGRHDDGL